MNCTISDVYIKKTKAISWGLKYDLSPSLLATPENRRNFPNCRKGKQMCGYCFQLFSVPVELLHFQ